MQTNSCFTSSNLIRTLVVSFLCCVFGLSAAHAQEAAAPKAVLDFEGNKIFQTQELLEVANKCLAANSKSQDEDATLDYCLDRVTHSLRARGYLQARLSEPRHEQTESGSRTMVSVTEGALFRLGEVAISGTRTLAPTQVREMLAMKTGDIADGGKVSEWLFERVKKAYGNLGYIQYTAEVQPTFHHKEGASEGVADFAVTIDEGVAFTVASIRFDGNGSVSRDALLREMLVRNGEVFSQDLLEDSLTRLSQNGQFEMIDPNRDVYYEVDKKEPRVSLLIHLKKREAGAALVPLPRPTGQAVAIQPIPEHE
jgi:outer membrane protein insertion porin family